MFDDPKEIAIHSPRIAGLPDRTCSTTETIRMDLAAESIHFLPTFEANLRTWLCTCSLSHRRSKKQPGESF